jgi:hypothetical protein
MAKTAVYLIPYLDGDWLGYGPLDPTIGYGLLPPNEDEIIRNLSRAVGFWSEHTGGRMVFGAHTGTYCRELFYREPALGYYRELSKNGGEIAVHPHEERVASAHCIDDLQHMRFIISWKRRELLDAGIKPTAFRLPYNGYVAGLTRILEENNLLVDLSAAPGFVNSLWRANWKGAPFSAYYLDYDDPSNGSTEFGNKSQVLEVPMGCDGAGAGPQNYLFNEVLPVDHLIRIWDAIRRRAEKNGAQMVYFLSHLHSMGDPELTDRCSRFLRYATGFQ